MKTVRLGTRGSELALTQSRCVASQIEAANPSVRVELVIIKTRGDRDQRSALNKFGGKGIFTKEIEEALLGGEVDLAVHSLKDLPTTLPAGLALAAPPRREDPRDLLVSSVPLMDLPEGSVVGTGSARRREQLRQIRPDLRFDEIRGNVPTRVRKWREGMYDATVLACAGVARIGMDAAGLAPSEAHPLPFEQCLPAPGQGTLGLEIREADEETERLLSSIVCVETAITSTAERAFLAELEGGCHIPAGAYAALDQEQLTVTAFLASETSGERRGRRTTLKGPPEQAEELGRQAARQLKSEG